MKKCFCMCATRNKVPRAAPALRTALAAACLVCLGGCAGGRQMASESRTVSLEREYARSAEVLHVRDTVVLGVPMREGAPLPTAHAPFMQSGQETPAMERAVPVYRSHYETLRVHDTVLVTRTDTLVRTETRTVRERYVPPWLRRYAVGVTLLAAGLLLAAGAAWYVRRRMRLWR